MGEFEISTESSNDAGNSDKKESNSSSPTDYKKNYTYEDWLREQQEEEIKKARERAGAPNLAVSSMPAFASLEDVLRYFLYEESGVILDAGADKLEESLILHNVESVRIGPSAIALNNRRQNGFAGEGVVASISTLPFKDDSFVRCVCSKGLESLSNTVEVTNALVELSRVCKTTIITLRQYGDSIVHRVIFTRMFVDRLVKGIGIHYGILRREDGDFVIYLLSKDLQSAHSLAMEYAGEAVSQKVVGRAKVKQLQKADPES
ncbi:MAG: hypothetical protein PXY39_10170 [archaeon]|nr:hypothetical protein [archaeon]